MYELELYLCGGTKRSEKAIEDLKALLDANFGGQYVLKIINVIENPELAEENDIIATPTVVKISPLPMKRIIGDLSNAKSVLTNLGLGESE